MSEGNNSIVFKDVCKSYDGKVNIIDHLDMTIPSNQRLILLGPSGCGKSTILRMIAGLEQVTSGELYLGDQMVNDFAPGERNIAMVFQSYALYPHMTVEENILFGMKIAKVPKADMEKNLTWALDILGLTAYRKRYPRELSGGQRQRVALCRALVKKSPYLLLDEPLSNLDAQLRTNARAELVKIHKLYAPTFVYVTHDQIEAMTVGQSIVVLNNSKIQQNDTPFNIYNRPANEFVARFIGSPSMNICRVKIDGGRMWINEEGIPLPDMWLRMIGNRKEVKLGIRPEHFVIGQQSGDKKISISYMEDHGNCKCLTFPMNDVPFIATVDATQPVSQQMYASFPWKLIHFFDAESGMNLGYPEAVLEEQEKAARTEQIETAVI